MVQCETVKLTSDPEFLFAETIIDRLVCRAKDSLQTGRNKTLLLSNEDVNVLDSLVSIVTISRNFVPIATNASKLDYSLFVQLLNDLCIYKFKNLNIITTLPLKSSMHTHFRCSKTSSYPRCKVKGFHCSLKCVGIITCYVFIIRQVIHQPCNEKIMNLQDNEKC